MLFCPMVRLVHTDSIFRVDGEGTGGKRGYKETLQSSRFLLDPTGKADSGRMR